MKTIAFTILITALSTLQGLAKVVTVSNSTRVPAQYYVGSLEVEFFNLTDFIDSYAVAEGDQVIVMPTTASYNSITINKAITITSNGHYDREGVGRARFNDVYIKSSNVSLEGLYIWRLTPNTDNNKIENFYLKDCKVGSSLNLNNYASNCYFEGNVFDCSISIRTTSNTKTKSNVVFQNNLLTGNTSLYIDRTISSNQPNLSVDIRFINNTFVGANKQNTSPIEGVIFANNVFSGWAFNAASTTGNTFFHNVFAAAGGLPAGNDGTNTNNQVGYAVSFVNTDGNGTYDYGTEDLRLAQQPYTGQQVGITNAFVGTGSPVGAIDLTITNPILEQNEPITIQITNNQ